MVLPCWPAGLATRRRRCCHRSRRSISGPGQRIRSTELSAARLEQVLNALLTGDSIEARLSNALASSSTPLDRVLVVNGIDDALVPVANARRLVENLRTSAPAASSSLRLARSRRRRVPPAGLCVLAKADGHVMLGKDYIKTVERGVEVSRTTLSTEKAWRDALEANFGITL